MAGKLMKLMFKEFSCLTRFKLSFKTKMRITIETGMDGQVR